MSIKAIQCALENRATSGVARLAILAIADGGGKANIEQICRWVNCDEGGAIDIMSDLQECGLVEEDYCDETDSMKFFSRWLHDITYGPAPRKSEVNRYIPAHIRAQVYEECLEQCQYCGDVIGPFHIDHIHPVSRGGGNERSNLTLACKKCNLSKSDKTLEEWVQ